MTTAIVPVQVVTIGKQADIQTVNGRDLWNGLELTRYYTTWVQEQIVSLKLVENQDFTTSLNLERRGSRSAWCKEFHFTLDAAKHIAMASRSPKGKEVREYFIKVEQEYLATQVMVKVPAPMAGTERQAMTMALRILTDGFESFSADVEELKAVVREGAEVVRKLDEQVQAIAVKQDTVVKYTKPVRYYTVYEYAKLHGQKTTQEQRARISMKATELTHKMGYNVKRRFSKAYPKGICEHREDALQQAFSIV